MALSDVFPNIATYAQQHGDERVQQASASADMQP
jgi:hypothetical protein